MDPAVNGSNANISRWDMDSAFFFAGTVITTIGTQGLIESFADRINMLGG